MPEEGKNKTTTETKPSTKKQPSQRTRRIVGSVLVGFVCILIGAGGVIAVQELQQNGGGLSLTPHTTVENDGNTVTTAEEQTIDSVIEKASPSVVSVLTKITVGNYFYGTSTEEGAGSGIIVSSDGIILTNKHVVSGADTVSVVLADGSAYNDVEVVVTDPLNDVAFLKIPDVSDLPVAELGDSSTVRVGQSVIAIGNSLGQYKNTVTRGIISGTGRPVSAQDGSSVETLDDLLQTDAAINPGNSGGPLLNTSGQVIGINTAIIEGAEGIGFSIPINATKGFLKQVLAGESASRAYLGIRYMTVNAAVAKEFDLSVSTGAYIYASNSQQAVVSGSPADKAGIKTGDVITKINDVEVGKGGGVSSLIAEYAPGDTIKITFVRGNDTKTVNVTLSSYAG